MLIVYPFLYVWFHGLYPKSDVSSFITIYKGKTKLLKKSDEGGGTIDGGWSWWCSKAQETLNLFLFQFIASLVPYYSVRIAKYNFCPRERDKVLTFITKVDFYLLMYYIR